MGNSTLSASIGYARLREGHSHTQPLKEPCTLQMEQELRSEQRLFLLNVHDGHVEWSADKSSPKRISQLGEDETTPKH